MSSHNHAKKRRVRLTAYCWRCGVLFYDFQQHTCATDPADLAPAREKKWIERADRHSVWEFFEAYRKDVPALLHRIRTQAIEVNK